MSLGKSLTRISQKVSQRGVSEGREYVAFLIARDSGLSVPSQKLVVYIGEQSAALARRADDGISGIFRGGPTPPASLRAGEIHI